MRDWIRRLVAEERGGFPDVEINSTLQGINPRHGCELRRAAVQSIPNAAVTLVSWDTETVDTDGYIAVPSTTITIPGTFGGLYLATLAVNFAASGVGLNRDLDLILNGATNIAGRHYAPNSVAGNQTRTTVAFALPLVPGDTITAQVFQNSLGALNIFAQIGLYRIAA